MDSLRPVGDPRADPRRLLRRFVLYSILSVGAILLLVVTGLHYIYRGQLVKGAQASSVAIAEALFEHEREAMVRMAPDEKPQIFIEDADYAGFDQRMRLFLRAFGMVKIKIYDADRKIRYSTDTMVVGKIDGGNAQLGRALLLGEVDTHVEAKDKLTDLRGEERFGVDVVETYVPLRMGDAVIGSFEVYTDITPAYESLATVTWLSLAVLVVVLTFVFGILFIPMRQGTRRLSLVQEQLRDMAAIDVLTGLFNRRQLFARIGSEFARAERASRRHEPREDIGFVMVDIDHFKSINDTHGHAGGDEILRQVAARLKGLVRAYDAIGRYGGEEFLVMLPNTNAVEAKVVAERMRRAIAETPFTIANAALPVTASFGVASSPAFGADAETAIRRADESLYRAKEAGRNRVVSAA